MKLSALLIHEKGADCLGAKNMQEQMEKPTKTLINEVLKAMNIRMGKNFSMEDFDVHLVLVQESFLRGNGIVAYRIYPDEKI